MRFCFYVILITIAATACLSAGPPATVNAPVRVVAVNRTDPRSGQIVRTVVVESRPVASRVVSSRPVDSSSPGGAPSNPVPSDVKNLVEDAARNYNLNVDLVNSVIQVESNYNPRAVSPKGAQGLMQLMPGTARRFGAKNSFDPKENIEAGVRYLKFLQETFKDERLAIAAYNAGEGAVQKYGNVPPYPETLDYVAKVGKKYGDARRASAAKKKSAANGEPDVTPKEPEHRPLVQYVDSDGKIYLATH
jgi:soluble lytic murein transglycosylase-like protein